MMYLTKFLPDWNSLDSVRRAHSHLEATALVFAETLAHLSNDERREKLFDKIGLCFFAIALLAEIAAYPYGQRNDALSQQIIGSLDTTARDAASKASNALTDSGTALSQAGEAETKSGTAIDKSNRANASASTALTVARGAHAEANSFEADILSAKKQAADATEELNRLKSPRILTNAMGFSSALKPFAGTEYTFSSVSEDGEAIDLLKQIDSALQLAGWTRVKPSSPPVIVLNVYGQQQDFGVAIGTGTGIEVEVDSTDSIDLLRTTPQQMWPRPVKIAGALRNALATCITPTEGNVRKDVVVEQGSSSVVRIMVGKKP